MLDSSSASGGPVILSAGTQLVVVATTATVYLSAIISYTGTQPGSYGFVGAIRLI